MRLLRTDTAELVLENVEDGTCEYAILSHRWFPDAEEVTYQDIVSNKEDLHKKRGWQKLDYCRLQAAKESLKYIWADTACIDKSSSQELTESINSMYQWYRDAKVCYVYLHDMPDPADDLGREETHVVNEEPPSDDVTNITDNCDSPTQRGDPETSDCLPSCWDREAFKESQCFKRGWTLQEMLAPRVVIFYSKSWFWIGRLNELASIVSDITAVHKKALTKTQDIRSYSIAQRMSWAAKRSTTKIEDRAYSLLGLMDVNLPVIYGEGKKAFQRLQGAILSSSADDSIFLFGKTFCPGLQYLSDHSPSNPACLLADSPADFQYSHEITLSPSSGINNYQLGSKEVKFTSFQVVSRGSILHSLLNPVEFVHQRSLKNRSLLLSRCTIGNEPSRVVALNLYQTPRSGAAFVALDWSKRLSIVDTGDLGKCPRRNLSIVRRPGEINASMSEVAVVCRSVIRDTYLCATPQPQSDIWQDKDYRSTLVFTPSQPSSDEDSLPSKRPLPEFRFDLTLSGPNFSSCRAYIAAHPNTYNVFRVTLASPSVSFPDWTTFILGSNSFGSAIKRHEGRFLVAHVFARKCFPPDGRHFMLFNIESMSISRFASYTLYRLVLALTSLLMYISIWIIALSIPILVALAAVPHTREIGVSGLIVAGLATGAFFTAISKMNGVGLIFVLHPRHLIFAAKQLYYVLLLPKAIYARLRLSRQE